MQSLIGFDPTHLVATYGYPAVTLVIALESMGVPLPGETVLITGAIYAGATHQLSIVLVVAAMAGGVLWAVLYGVGGYALGSTVQRIAGPVGIGFAMLAVAAVVAVTVFLRRHKAQLSAEAERAFPGSLAPPARMGAR